jgi:hypothetical protein
MGQDESQQDEGQAGYNTPQIGAHTSAAGARDRHPTEPTMIDRFARPSPRIERALDVARVSHEGAVRKGTTIPYIEHPVGVALLLESHGYPEDLVVAGLLHDTVEDTKYGSPEVQQRLSRIAGGNRLPCPSAAMEFRRAFLTFLSDEFGRGVLDLVLAVTEQKNDGGVALDWLERKRQQLSHLAEASPAEAALKAADATHNIESTLKDVRAYGLGVLDRFRGGSLIVWHYSAIAELAGRQMASEEPLAIRVREAARQLSETIESLRPHPTTPVPYPPPRIC